MHDRTNVSNCPVCHKTFNTTKRMRKHLFSTHKDVADDFRVHTKVEQFADAPRTNAFNLEITNVE